MKSWKCLLFMLLLASMPMIAFAQNSQESLVQFIANEVSSNNYLRSVTIDGVDFQFDKSITDYEIRVPYSLTTLNLEYTLDDSEATAEFIGGEELYIGNNSVVILVMAPDGSMREYDFTIIRNSDNTVIANDENSILSGLNGNDSSNLTVEVTSESATTLGPNTVNTFKNSNKTLIYKWLDSNGNFKSSLKIDGSLITTTDEINPNIKNSISDVNLLKQIDTHPYIALSTVGTNIPEGSIYTLAVSGEDDIYYLYYYDNDILNKKPLRKIDGKVEFEVKSGIDYALLGSSDVPAPATIRGFSWLWPSIIITLLIIIFIFATRRVMFQSVKNSAKKRE